MQYRLTDNDRTLLSAYVDGELAGGDLARTEELMARSGEAREYVADLRALNGLSSAAFPAVTATGAAIGAGTVAKLSGGAIKAAAEKSIIAKGILGGGWGIAGLATGAVAIATGVTLMVNSAPERDRASYRQPAQVAAAPAATRHAMPAAQLDTSALVVPAMTPAELVRFAVKGTLPIDSKRNQFVKVAALHDGPVMEGSGAQLDELDHELENINRDLERIDWNRIVGLDSLREQIRTAVLRQGGQYLVRPDIPTLRLQLLQRIENCNAQEISGQTRQRLNVIRQQVESLHATLGQQRLEISAGENGGNQIGYVVLSGSELNQLPNERGVIQIPQTSFGAGAGSQTIFVGRTSLNELCQRAPSAPFPVAATEATTAFRSVVTRKRDGSLSTSVKSPVSNPTGTPAPTIQSLIDSSSQEPQYSPNGTSVDELLRQAEEQIRRVDTLMDTWKIERLRRRRQQENIQNLELRMDDKKGDK